MTERHNAKDIRRNTPKRNDGQPEPRRGSKKVKNRNHSRQNHGEGS